MAIAIAIAIDAVVSSRRCAREREREPETTPCDLDVSTQPVVIGHLQFVDPVV